MIEVSTESFHRMIYNAKLLQVGKDAPPVEFLFEGDRRGGRGSIRTSVSDGHMYLEDRTDCSLVESPGRFSVSAADIKQLELALRTTEDEYLDIYFDGPQFYVEDLGFEAHVPIPVLPKHHALNEWNWATPTIIEPFAIMGDRFRKLSLIKPGDFPVDFKLVYHSGYKSDILVFKAGPTVQGALSLLDRKILENEVDSDAFLW